MGSERMDDLPPSVGLILRLKSTKFNFDPDWGSLQHSVRPPSSISGAPYQLEDIARIESVQRRFTKRLSGLSNDNYSSRLETLE